MSIERSRSTTLRLLSYCRDRDWAGPDPYDALNSPLFTAVPFLNHRVTRLVVTQALKRLPVNLRGLFRVPDTQNPKGLALFLSASLRLARLGLVGGREDVSQLFELLVNSRSTDTPYWCWGYSFPWQTRTALVPRGAPNLVCTTFVANALLDLHEDSGDPRCLEMATSSAEYIANELYWEDGQGRAGFGYPLPSDRSLVHNANFLGAALLCRVDKHIGGEQLRGQALKVARYSVSRQQADGSWYYGELPRQRWIDNFHTGFNLSALHSINRSLGSQEFEPALHRGFSFYRGHFIREDGAARYFHNRTHPIDIHSVAQTLLTLIEFEDLHPDASELVGRVLAWALETMWDEEGFFYYRVLPALKNRIPYMRWSQAWMLLALSELLTTAAGWETGQLKTGGESRSLLARGQ